MKKLLPLLFFFTCFSCYDNDTSKVSESVSPSKKESPSQSVSQDSTDKVIKQQQDLLNKVYEMQDKNRDTSRSYIYFSCTVMDKSNQYIELNSKIYTVSKKDSSKIESIKTCLKDIIKKYYYLNSDVILMVREFATFKEANEHRAQFISAKEIVLDSSCK